MTGEGFVPQHEIDLCAACAERAGVRTRDGMDAIGEECDACHEPQRRVRRYAVRDVVVALVRGSK